MPAEAARGGTTPEPRSRRQDRTALVLAGGAARGAYEVGVIQHVLEDVARDLGRPIHLDVLCGTSVGALNACGLAAFADLAPAARVARIVDVWTHLDVNEMVQLDVKGVMNMGARLLGRAVPKDSVPVREGGLIAPEGLERLIEGAIPFARIHDNLRAGHLDALTVSTTHVASGRTVVYVHRESEEVPRWSHDPTTVARAARITARHALASAAIPILYRAVELDGDYHCDGGLRQNVPLSPARRLGASRVLVVNPRYIETAPLDDSAAEGLFPGPLFLLGKTLNALLLDRIDTDLSRLQTINRILDAGTRFAGEGFVAGLNHEMGFAEGNGLRPLRALLVRASQDIGRMAAEHVRKPVFAKVGGMAGRLMRRLAEPESRNEADLLSYLLFDGGFAADLIELGRADARARHDDLCAFFTATAPAELA
jgi:NTE family protein